MISSELHHPAGHHRSIREVPFGELIIALYTSDMPDAGPAPEDLPVGQLVGWTVQGIARLGEVEVWHRNYRMRTQQIDFCEVFGNATREQYAADLAPRWTRRWKRPASTVSRASAGSRCCRTARTSRGSSGCRCAMWSSTFACAATVHRRLGGGLAEVTK
ncbi:hypothetical protein [Microbispora sp. NPDC046933]|uniref:hypothetical protein n=1 Tax=Microbispora sp. NPDC046933 TaxID=3155618 RepID=UPI0033D5F5F7